jgi:hypothetical protein
MQKLKGFQTGDTVITPHGVGTVCGFEVLRTTERVQVKLNDNPFSFPVACYFLYEVKHAASKSEN